MKTGGKGVEEKRERGMEKRGRRGERERERRKWGGGVNTHIKQYAAHKDIPYRGCGFVFLGL